MVRKWSVPLWLKPFLSCSSAAPSSLGGRRWVGGGGPGSIPRYISAQVVLALGGGGACLRGMVFLTVDDDDDHWHAVTQISRLLIPMGTCWHYLAKLLKTLMTYTSFGDNLLHMRGRRCDTDFKAVDPDGYSCLSYSAKHCGNYDDQDFSSVIMCCVCGAESGFATLYWGIAIPQWHGSCQLTIVWTAIPRSRAISTSMTSLACGLTQISMMVIPMCTLLASLGKALLKPRGS